MTRRLTFWDRLGVLFGLLALAQLSAALTGCGDSLGAPGIGQSAQTTDALALLPGDADVYGMTNLAAARESDAVEAALGTSGLGMVTGRGSADFDEFVRLTGFDPSTDLDRVYIAGREGHEGGAFVAYGRFDRDRIEQFVADQDEMAFEVSDVDGIPVYLGRDDDGDPRGGFALVNDRMVIAGDEATLRDMLTRVGTTGAAPDAELQALFDRVAYPDGAWFVARGFGGAMQIPDDAPPSAMAARAAEGFVVSMAFERGGIPVRAFLATKPEASTEDVADVVRGGISAARIGLKDQPEALDVLDGVDVDAEDAGVAISGYLTPDFLASANR